MAQAPAKYDRYVSDFEAFERSLLANGPMWVHQIRQQGLSRFTELGLPTARRGNEKWKYTSVVPIANTTFEYPFDLNPDEVKAADIRQIAPWDDSWVNLVFVNGRYCEALSTAPARSNGEANGAHVANLADVFLADGNVAEKHLARYASVEDDAFTALNTAFLKDGAFVHVPEGYSLQSPLHLLYLTTDRAQPTVSHPRALIVAGRHSKLTIIESYVSLSHARYFTNAVTEIVVEDGAKVEHYRLLMDSPDAFHVGTTRVYQGPDSTFSSASFASGAALARNDLLVVLDAPGSSCFLNGLYMTSGTQHIDNYINIDHAKPHTTSRLYYKGILDGSSKAVFGGTVLVRQGAQKADAQQSDKNLILSEAAEIDSKPSLLIYADDVKCGHGATAGHIDEDIVFYMRSRGLDLEMASSLLIQGFASEIIEAVQLEPFRAYLDRTFLGALPNHFYPEQRTRSVDNLVLPEDSSMFRVKKFGGNIMTSADPMASQAASGKVAGAFDVARIREEFPILKQQVHGKPLVYLDNAATSQKPQVVIDTLTRYYTTENSNVHRGVHQLSVQATEEYEGARAKVRRLLNASDDREIIFVRGTTEGINLVAQSYGRQHVGEGDEIIISAMEHHSNIVPWQILCQERGAHLRVIPINDDGELLMDEYEKLLCPRTKLVSVVHMSNSLGTINPIQQIVAMAHSRGVPVLLDGAQSTPHMVIDVRKIDCDFFAFSGHKLFGPTGIGVLYGKAALLDSMPPYQGGGDMIRSVTFEKTTYNSLPYKFEAGTPNIGGVIGMGAAIDYITALGLDRISDYEHELLGYGMDRLSDISGLQLIGTAREKAGILSFVLEGIHPHDIGTILDAEGIAIRAGHHCTQPLMDRFGIPATARASLAFYNTKEEIDALIKGIDKAIEIFS